jgi:hypothetical protein
LTQSYESSVAKRFALAVEQLDQCAELIQDGGIPKVRMAVVLTDNLADTFLYRLCLSYIARADQDTLGLTKRVRISGEQFERLRNEFAAKLDFVAKMHVAQDMPRLTPPDVDVIAIGHRYRNAIYHRDSHNPLVVPVLARLFFRATCRLFQISNYSHLGGHWSESIQRDLEALQTSYRVLDDKGIFWPVVAADKVSDVLQRRIAIDLAYARQTLSADLRARSQNLRRLIAKFGIGTPELKVGLRETEFWRLHGYDGALTELANRADMWLRRDEFTGANAEKAWLDMDEARGQLREVAEQMVAVFRPKASLDAIAGATKVAERLMKFKHIGSALRAYYDADRRLEDLEESLWAMEEEWERAIDRENERRREESP